MKSLTSRLLSAPCSLAIVTLSPCCPWSWNPWSLLALGEAWGSRDDPTPLNVAAILCLSPPPRLSSLCHIKEYCRHKPCSKLASYLDAWPNREKLCCNKKWCWSVYQKCPCTSSSKPSTLDTMYFYQKFGKKWNNPNNMKFLFFWYVWFRARV